MGEERPGRAATAETLLDRLLYKGVLPRYAFPTDVAAFHVFDPDRSTRFRPAFRFTPSQGLPVALSQYAPGKEVWIGNKLWTSGAIYSPLQSDRFKVESRRYTTSALSAITRELNPYRMGAERSKIAGVRGEEQGQQHIGSPPGFAPL